MTPGARTQAVIDLLDTIFPLPSGQGETGSLPPDRLLKRWVRENRYAGSKDRRAIQSLFYDVLRHLGPLVTALGDRLSPRLCVAALLNRDGDSAELFTGIKYAPAPLSEEEQAILTEQPVDWAHANFPDRMIERFRRDWQDRAPAIMASLNRQAALDVRVNLKRASVEEVASRLEQEGVSAHRIFWCPSALRIEGPTRIDQTGVFAEGLIEVQDAGSQVISRLCAGDLTPDARVLDFCAGAGGKTLALIDQVDHPDHIVASDIDARRLGRMTPRLERLGNPPISRIPQSPQSLEDWREAFDFVMADAPCSGSGAWARDPLASWQTSEERMTQIGQAQIDVLDKASACVRPGGLLAYITCSLFAEENGDQVAAFLERNTHFKPTVPSADTLKEVGLTHENMANGQLTITPDRPLSGAADGETSDGFFLAMFRREG